ncbi:MAG: helix-turn-helix domain-containing protein, partial [Solirubrobacteraceae bacterium]
MGEHISDPRFAAFYGLLVVEWRITERLDAQLQGTAGMSLNRFELLMQLHFKDGSRRMSDLADALLLSRGGATRVVARAEEDELVRREIP